MNMIGRVVITVTLSVAAIVSSQSTAAAAVPYQWIAKQYTEGLGRGPDAGGWKNSVDWFTTNGCNQANLKNQGQGFLTSAEFTSKGYNNAQLVFTAFRSILSREPDSGGFNNYNSCLSSGTCTWSQVIDALYNSSEFSGLVSAICAGSNYRDDLGGGRPIVINGERSQSTLQAQLDAGGTVSLQPQEVVYLTGTLTIPANATLTTTGLTSGTETAKMGRLIRDAAFSGTLVVTNGTIDKVWIDGQGGRFVHDPAAETLAVAQGMVTNSRIAEPLGFSSVHAAEPCTAAPTITNNLVTAYTSYHPFNLGSFVDGLSLACNGTYAAGNYIIDATDVGIVLFARADGSGQNITVENNTILAAGRSAYGGLVMCDSIDVFDAPCDGSTERNNSLWTSAFQHFDIGLSVGTYPWGPGTASGGSATNNTTPTGLSMQVKNAIVIDGVVNTTVQGNVFSAVAVETNNGCQPMDAGVSADVTGGHASGSIQPYTDRAVHSCVGHN